MIWIIFFAIIAILLALDLGVFHKNNEAISMKNSLIWTGIWVSLALLFGIAIYWIYENDLFEVNKHGISGSRALMEYYTGYVIEESLSLDNIFVMAMIFKFFKVPNMFQHRILFWGIIGAVFFRLGMIVLGAAFIEKFDWAMYIFGGILIFSAFKMMRDSEESEDFQKSLGVRLLGKIIRIDWSINSGKYIERVNGKLVATSLLATLVVVEFSDILFAVDSIPAIFSVTKEPFIVFSSNIFAILGLRNLYFFLANMLDKFKYMKFSLIFVLLFVGIKMIFHNYLEILTEKTWISLVIILGLLTMGVLASVMSNKKDDAKIDA